jgi:hypothetical protein
MGYKICAENCHLPLYSNSILCIIRHNFLLLNLPFHLLDSSCYPVFICPLFYVAGYSMSFSVVKWSEFVNVKPSGPGFDSRRYQILCVAVGLERGPLSFVSINEELLERKVAAPV